MSVESATYISQLDPTLPGMNDPKSEGDDHLRLTKSVLKAQFPNLGAAAVTVTATDLNSVIGKVAKSGDTYSGAHDMTGATVNVATQAATDASTKAASTQMVQNAILASSGITATLPGQGGAAGKVLKTNGTSPAWAFPDLRLSSRTANTQITANDSSAFIDITSGTFTQTFDACASLGTTWWCYIRNSGTGDITLDPNGSETIDGLTSYVMYPGEARLVMCDGSTLKTVVLASFYRTFTASGTFVTPPGYQQFAGLLWGGGGSGGKSNYRNGGGGGGACVPVSFPASVLPATVAVTIAATATGPSANGYGAQGNNSTFGSLLTAYGGKGGYGDGSTATYGGGGGGALGTSAGTLGGAPSMGAAGDNTGFGGGSAGFASVWGGGGGGGDSGSGGKSVYGGGGGGGGTGGSSGGSSVYGGAGGAYVLNSSGIDGTAPGGGGGGTVSGTKAGDGARGELRIWGVI